MFTIEIIYPRGENRTSRSLGILNVDEENIREERDRVIEEFSKMWGPNIVTYIEGID